MDEREAMKADIEKCEVIIKECISKLDAISFESDNDEFIEGIHDVINTVKMAAFNEYGYQGCPCNALDWMKDNLDYYENECVSDDAVNSEIISKIINLRNDDDMP